MYQYDKRAMVFFHSPYPFTNCLPLFLHVYSFFYSRPLVGLSLSLSLCVIVHPSRSPQALVICLKLLRDITARGQIPNSKKIFQSLAAACLSVLEKSDNIVLLTTVMGFVKDWLILKEPPVASINNTNTNTTPSSALSDQVCSERPVHGGRFLRRSQ